MKIGIIISIRLFILMYNLPTILNCICWKVYRGLLLLNSYHKQLFYSILQIETNYYSRYRFKVFLYFKLIWIDKMEIGNE